MFWETSKPNLHCLATLRVDPGAEPPEAPVFRGRIDLMQLDVTVLDKNGVPVRGLTKDDFTLVEDKTQQTIEAFKAVDLPDRVVAGPAWADKVAADVVTNEIDNARIFVLVIDDGFGMGGLELGSHVRPYPQPQPGRRRDQDDATVRGAFH
jgi:hypothetical protein